MKPRELTLDDLLSRVNLSIGFEEACTLIAKDYDLGTIEKIEPLLVGHSELNTRITTDKGKFVIKFFNRAKDKPVCEFVTHAMKLFMDNDVPVPRLLSSFSGFLYEMPVTIGHGYLIVMEFFDGNTFNQITPTLEDKIAVAKYLAQINILSSSTEAAYDPWLLPYLASEYDRHNKHLSAEDNSLVKPIVDTFRNITLSDFSHGVVHYDLHRDNVQKGKEGGYCIFDMETVGKGHPAIDLATYIGLTCLERNQSLEKNKEIYKTILDEYQSIRELNAYELENLELLIKGIFACNLIAANTLIKEGDDTQETYKWYELGKESLQKFSLLSLS